MSKNGLPNLRALGHSRPDSDFTRFNVIGGLILLQVTRTDLSDGGDWPALAPV